MRIPLHIITGFLGVGKTSTILNLMEKIKDKESVAVVVNERGTLGIDGKVLGSMNAGVEIREVTGGCICCIAGTFMRKALSEILENVGPDRILMEPSGISKPGDIIDLITISEFKDKIEIRPVISLVDPAEFIKPHVMTLPVFRDQVDAGDILVGNRCDLADRSVIDAFYQKAKRLFPPKISIFTTSFGQLSEDILSVKSEASRIKSKYLTSSNEFPSSQNESATPYKHEMYQELGWTWSDETIFDHQRTLDAFGTIRAMVHCETKVERAKGLFHTNKGWYLMELAIQSLHERPIQYRGASRFQIILSPGEKKDFESAISILLQSCISL